MGFPICGRATGDLTGTSPDACVRDVTPCGSGRGGKRSRGIDRGSGSSIRTPEWRRGPADSRSGSLAWVETSGRPPHTTASARLRTCQGVLAVCAAGPLAVPEQPPAAVPSMIAPGPMPTSNPASTLLAARALDHGSHWVGPFWLRVPSGHRRRVPARHAEALAGRGKARAPSCHGTAATGPPNPAGSYGPSLQLRKPFRNRPRTVSCA